MTEIHYLKPLPADSANSRSKVRLVPFPASQRQGGKRYLHPDGERVVCNTGDERRWWISIIRSGDVQVLDGDAAKAVDALDKADADAAAKATKDRIDAKKALDAAQGDDAKAEAKAKMDAIPAPVARVPWRGPTPVDRGSENVPKLIPAGPATPKKGK